MVLLHGVNNVDKDPPYMTLNDGFTLNDRDASLLAAHGFNTVRLGVEWDAMMPSRGVIDHAYLDRVKTVVDLLGARGIRVLIDNHQDSMSHVFKGGNGFPAWAVTKKPFKGEPDIGWPLNSATMFSLNLNWTWFWNNHEGLVDMLGHTFYALASKLKGDPNVLGYEIMNEPWPGFAAAACLGVGCPAFDRKYSDVHTALSKRIRDGDPDSLVFWEPHTLWNTATRTHLNEPPLTPKFTDPNIVFSFHDYCGFSEISIYFGAPAALKGACDTQHNITWSQFDSFQRRSGIPSILSEFGGTSDPAVVARSLPRADKRFVSWQYWHYASVFPPTGSPRKDPFTGDLGKQLVRTYPQATAGWPMDMHYDTITGALQYEYATRPSNAPTEIYVSDVQYPQGYGLSLKGACALSAPGARIVKLQNLPGAKTVKVGLAASLAGAVWPACT